MDASAEGTAVVVPADHGGSSLACIRSLGRRGVPVIGVTRSETAAAATRSKYCEETRVVSGDGVDDYREALLELACRPDVLTVLPLYETDVYVLSEHRAAFADHVATPWKPFDGVRRAQDRVELVAAAEDVGVPVPETALLDEWDGWDDRTVVKPRYTITVEDDRARFGDVHVVEAGETPDREGLVAEMGHVPIAQEYVPGGGEYGFFALFDRGEPVATFQHRRERSYTYAGGASVYRRAVDVPALERHGLALLEALDWHGPAMVEFRRDADDGSFRLLEVNPRFWGSLPLAVHAGVDFPSLYYDLAADRLDEPVFDYDVGVGCHTLVGELSYLHSVARYEFDHVDAPSLAGACYDVATSLLRDPRFDFASLGDARPFARQVANLLG